MLLIADWQLTHRAIERPAGVPFDEPDEVVAAELIHRGVARNAGPPKVLYDSFLKPASTQHALMIGDEFGDYCFFIWPGGGAGSNP